VNGNVEVDRATASRVNDGAVDFDDRRMFTVLTRLGAACKPYDPASVSAARMRSGADGAKDATLRRCLNAAVTVA
jgi:hypothetical protein